MCSSVLYNESALDFPGRCTRGLCFRQSYSRTLFNKAEFVLTSGPWGKPSHIGHPLGLGGGLTLPGLAHLPRAPGPSCFPVHGAPLIAAGPDVVWAEKTKGEVLRRKPCPFSCGV